MLRAKCFVLGAAASPSGRPIVCAAERAIPGIQAPPPSLKGPLSSILSSCVCVLIRVWERPCQILLEVLSAPT